MDDPGQDASPTTQKSTPTRNEGTSGSTRAERDSLGEMQVPARAYYGAQTARAVENFPISGIRFDRPFIRALGLIKKGAAIVNLELGLLERATAEIIARAAD